MPVVRVPPRTRTLKSYRPSRFHARSAFCAGRGKTRGCPSGREWRRAFADHVEPELDGATSRTLVTAAACRDGSRTTPPLPTLPLPTSNCGLTRATMSPPGSSGAATTGQHQAQRDERHVDHGEVRPCRQRRGVEAAHVGALEQCHARVLAQRPGELAVADVDGDYRRGAALQHAVGEAAGRCADVQHDASRHRCRRTHRGRAPASRRRG